MCDGDDVAAAFVTRDLVVGELLGSVPDSAPPVPLDADVRGQAKTLRLKIDPLERTLALDLRRAGDRARSVFLHRLGVLGIGWGEVTDDLVRGTGTFHETWSLRWRPELSVAIIDAAVWGTTVAGAASARIVSLAESADRLSAVTGAVVRVLLASLEEALDAGAARAGCQGGRGRGRGVADDRGAVAGPGGAVRRRARHADAVAVGRGGRAVRADLRGAARRRRRARRRRGRRGCGTRWTACTGPWRCTRSPPGRLLAGGVAGGAGHAGGAAGRARAGRGARDADARRRRGAAVAGGGAPASAPRCRPGCRPRRRRSGRRGSCPAARDSSGGGLLLVHDRELLGVVDAWVASLRPAEFEEVLPLLRRTFGEFTAPERASIGRAVRSLGGAGASAGSAAVAAGTDDLDAERARGAVRTVAAILGGGAIVEGAA